MISILIVEDEKSISNLIKINLNRAGFSSTVASDGQIAANILENQKFDLILLDIMLPEIDGYELMEYIRPMNIPVIFITAKASLNDRMKGLTSGAEDYIVKPFEIVELLARINIVLRRYNKLGDLLTFRNIMLDEESRVAKIDGKEIELTRKEFDLLVYFVRNKNITLFREKLYEEIWGEEADIQSRTLDLHIQRIRKKMGLAKYLRTIYKVGYRLEEKADEI